MKIERFYMKNEQVTEISSAPLDSFWSRDVAWTARLIFVLTLIGILLFLMGVIATEFVREKLVDAPLQFSVMEFSSGSLGVAVALAGAFMATLVARSAFRAQQAANKNQEDAAHREAKEAEQRASAVYAERVERDLDAHQAVLERIEDLFQVSERFVDDQIELVMSRSFDSVHEDFREEFTQAVQNLWDAIGRANRTFIPKLRLQNVWSDHYVVGKKASEFFSVSSRFGYFQKFTRSEGLTEFQFAWSAIRSGSLSKQSHRCISLAIRGIVLKRIEEEFSRLGDAVVAEYNDQIDLRNNYINGIRRVREMVEGSEDEYTNLVNDLLENLQEVEYLGEARARVIHDVSVSLEYLGEDVQKDIYEIEEKVKGNCSDLQKEVDILKDIVSDIGKEVTDLDKQGEEFARWTSDFENRLQTLNASLHDDIRNRVLLARHSVALESRYSVALKAGQSPNRFKCTDDVWRDALICLVAGLVVMPDAAHLEAQFVETPNEQEAEARCDIKCVNIGLAFLLDVASLYPDSMIELTREQVDVCEACKLEQALGVVPSNVGFRTRRLLTEESLRLYALYWPKNFRSDMNYFFERARKSNGLLAPSTGLRDGSSDDSEVKSYSRVAEQHQPDSDLGWMEDPWQ